MEPRKETGAAKKTKDTATQDRVEGVATGIYSVSYVAKGLEYIQGPSSHLDAVGQIIPGFYYFLHGLASIIKVIRGTYFEKVTHAMVTILDAISVLALTGAMLTPGIGWVVAAGATLIGWVGDTVIPAWYAKKELKNCEKQIAMLKQELSSTDSSNIDKTSQLHTQIDQWQHRATIAKSDYIAKRNNVMWGFVAVVGMALFACGPFGFATVGLIGSAIFVGLALRGAVNILANLWQGKKSETTAPSNEPLKTVTEASLSLRSEKDPKPELGKTQSYSTTHAAVHGNLEKKNITTVPESQNTKSPFIATESSVTKSGTFTEKKAFKEQSLLEKEEPTKKPIVPASTHK